MKTYYSSSTIINSNLRSIIGINFRLPYIKREAVTSSSDHITNPIPNKKDENKRENITKIFNIEEVNKNSDSKSVIVDRFDPFLASSTPVSFVLDSEKDSQIDQKNREIEGSFLPHFTYLNLHSVSPTPHTLESNYKLSDLLDKPMQKGTDAKSDNLYYRTRKGHYNYAFRSLFSSQQTISTPEQGASLNSLIKGKDDSNLILSNNYDTNLAKINIDLLNKSKNLSRTMKFVSLKYYWSNVMNPSRLTSMDENVKLTDYYTNSDHLNNIYQGYYNSNIDALISNLNYLNLHLFSK